jgi:hypothetical protein
MFTSFGINLPETSASAIFWMQRFWLAHTSIRCRKGSVLSCSGYHSEWNSCRRMTVCTYYMQRTHSFTHYAYLFRTAPCTDSPELPLYDGVLRESLVTNQYIDLDDHRWSQAMLPVRWSGLGIRRVASLAPSAYLHGFSREHCRASSRRLSSRLDCAKSLTVECMATVMAAWIMLTSCPSTSSTAIIYCYHGLLSLYHAGTACAQ